MAPQTRRADVRPRWRVRWGAAVLVTALHLLAALVLVRAFAPGFTAVAVRTVTSTFDIPAALPTTPPSSPAPQSRAAAPPAQGAAGAAGAAGRRASRSGGGSGAGGEGTGRGADASGSGAGGGGAAAPVKIAGDIHSARDYPRRSRDLRLGQQVVVILRVGIDGKVKACRVAQPSPDAEADRITCRLASDRFRFRPARDAAGNAVEGDYGWRQRWFLTGQE